MTLGTPLWLLALPLAAAPLLGAGRRMPFPSLAAMQRGRSIRLRLSPLPRLLSSLSILCIVFALARPQDEHRMQVSERDGIDIMLLVDASGSMEAEDYSLGGREVSRMDVSKAVIGSFVEARPNDRIGVVVFGEEAFTQVPLTLDHSGMQPFIRQIEIGLAGAKATAIGNAIAVGGKRLRDLPAPSKVMILLTDGQSNAGIDPGIAAEAVAQHGIRVYTIGIGAEKSSFFGLVQGRSDLDEGSLKGIAGLTGGAYFRAKDTETLRSVYQEIDSLEPTTAEFREYVLREERYLPWALSGLLLLLFGAFLGETWLRRLP